jgi:hypothetical protein
MHLLTASELLAVWERSRGRPPVQQALILLAAANPDTSVDMLLKMEVGKRDSLLIKMREWTFGPLLSGMAICPACGEDLDVEVRTSDITALSKSQPGAVHLIEAQGYKVHFRLPNSADLLAILGTDDLDEARRILLDRCVVSIYNEGRQVPLSLIPQEIMRAVSDGMEEMDPQGDILLDISCISCGHSWKIVFDIVTFFWTEIDAWAHRILREVHDLAKAYGWREADILAMSPWRRQIYLEMVGE